MALPEQLRDPVHPLPFRSGCRVRLLGEFAVSESALEPPGVTCKNQQKMKCALIINSGSSSLKLAIYTAAGDALYSALAESLGAEGARIRSEDGVTPLAGADTCGLAFL